MKIKAAFFTALGLVFAAESVIAHGVGTQVPAPRDIVVAGPLPAVAAGVSELRFSEMFKMPVGPLGLEASATLLGLNGRPVRIVGYMANDALPVPGRLILAAL